MATAVTTDPGGDVYVVGYTSAALGATAQAGVLDMFLLKYDGSGNLLFTRQLGVSGTHTQAIGVTVDANGYVLVGGVTDGALDGISLTGTADLFITRYDGAGVKQTPTWHHGWPGVMFAPNAMTADASGNLYFVGTTAVGLDGNPQTGSKDFFLTKFDNAGTWKFTTQDGGSGTQTAGNAVAADQLGNIYVAGTTGGNLDGLTLSGAAYNAGFLARYAIDGTKGTTQLTAGTTDATGFFAMTTDAGGNVYLAGFTFESTLDNQTANGPGDAVVTKYSSAGSKQFTELIGATGAYVTGYAIALGRFGDLYVSGQTQGALVAPLIGNRDMFLAPLTSSGGSIMQ